MAKNKRVVRYKAPININVGIVVFGIIFLYVAVYVIRYYSQERVTYYEVVKGTVADDSSHSYTAIALRNEKVSFTEESGYINFYAREGSRVAKNTTLYSLDKSGKINELLAKMSDEDKKLSDSNIATIKKQLSGFVNNYSEMEFHEVYNFKSSIQGNIIELLNNNAIENIYKSLGDSSEGQFTINKAENTGIVEYFVDNYEDLKAEDLKKSDFDKENRHVAKINTGELVEKGAPIYKTVTQEQWKLAIPLSDEDVEKYADKTAIKIRFKKDKTKVVTNFEIVKGADKKKYGIFTFQKYMIKYAADRFIDIEIIEDNITGLKIPKKSLVNKDFYVIPIEYKTSGGAGKNKKDGFIVRKYEKTKAKDVFVAFEIHNEDDKYCYIDMNDLNAGDEIIMPSKNKKALSKEKSETDDKKEKESESSESETSEGDSSEGDSSEGDSSENNNTTAYSDVYIVRDTQSLTGVYNINNGYTQFVFVNKLTESGDYYIVESHNKYGVVVYDHIILNADMVKENQVIFQ
ncbi:MAG: hypothetical protein K6G88_15785 [Lachnospiraceae bacterium]|nr:hypothetical protein [Lachnospiraceae bacterium]